MTANLIFTFLTKAASACQQTIAWFGVITLAHIIILTIGQTLKDSSLNTGLYARETRCTCP